MSGNESKVYIVDDDPSVREAVTMLLKSEGYSVETFPSGKIFLESYSEYQGPACAILDVKMPGFTGLDLQSELITRGLDLPIIFITGHGNIPMSVQAIKKGAVNFLSKPFNDEDFLQTVKEALNQSSRLRQNRQLKVSIEKRFNSLTNREYEVMSYLIAGWINKRIGFKLNISERTVKAHRKQVFTKMKVESLAELVRLTEKVSIQPAETSIT